jgi:hypothetical protein
MIPEAKRVTGKSACSGRLLLQHPLRTFDSCGQYHKALIILRFPSKKINMRIGEFPVIELAEAIHTETACPTALDYMHLLQGEHHGRLSPDN